MVYTAEQRKQAVEAVKRGASYSAVAKHIGADKEHVAKWCKDPEKWCVDKNAEAIAQAFRKEEGVAPKSAAPSFVNHTEFSDNSSSQGMLDSIVMAIPDLHCPFEHPDALAFLKAVRAQYKPTTFVCLGDEIDAHAFSRFPKDPDGLTGGQEMQRAREHLLPFYLEFPNMLVCESNHTVRPWKIAFEHGLPASFLPTYAAFMNAPDGWVWQSRHEVDGVLYIHGDAGKSGQYAHVHYVKAFKKSVVIGHIHSYAGVAYEGNLFGANSGCLIDATAYCFKYAKNMPISVNLGCTLVFNGKHAQFIPMHLDEHGRWTGKL